MGDNLEVQEKDFPAPDGTQVIRLTQEKALELWDKLNQIPGLFDDFTVNRPDLFFQALTARNSVWLERIDGNGILYLKNVIPGLSASGHIVYWDKRLRGREKFTMDTLRWLMKYVPLQKVNLYLPDYAPSLRHFASRCGFKEEGCIRRWSYSRGTPFDIYVYGITRDEAFAQAEEEDDGPVHGADSNGVRSEEQGVREPVHGLDQPTTGDGSTGDSDKRTGSEPSES